MRAWVSKLKEVAPLVSDILILEEDRLLVIIIKSKEKLEKIRKRVSSIKTGYKTRYVLSESLLKEKELIRYLSEGKSLLDDKPIMTRMNASEQAIVTYSLENLDHVKKTQFGYALKGRDSKSGVLKELKGKTLGRNSFILPKNNLLQAEDFLKHWNITYSTKRVIEVK